MSVLELWAHTVWGDNIEWTSWEGRTLHGWLPDRAKQIKIGTELRARMQSGKIGRFEVVELRFPHDVPDMFFATVKDIGYL